MRIALSCPCVASLALSQKGCLPGSGRGHPQPRPGRGPGACCSQLFRPLRLGLVGVPRWAAASIMMHCLLACCWSFPSGGPVDDAVTCFCWPSFFFSRTHSPLFSPNLSALVHPAISAIYLTGSGRPTSSPWGFLQLSAARRRLHLIMGHGDWVPLTLPFALGSWPPELNCFLCFALPPSIDLTFSPPLLQLHPN
ncbi:hypothetical protein EDB81DRAFT_150873 [Dactylonectria macrodidyma]|uniref:Uncharacterized protein n=1 Tax=Dactylonectria macrodidyma TaxID=307937 RepID=A0A9P9JGV2_9HYPO|nr:hypothetical protein EDB81DRAFT_150873 [Dactylonectria macrodidyma]